MQMREYVAALDLGARAFQHGAALVHDQIAVGDALGEGEILLDDDQAAPADFFSAISASMCRMFSHCTPSLGSSSRITG